MTPVTLIMAYYENPGMLAKQFEILREMDPKTKSMIKVIIVDDGSPNHPAKPEEIGADLQIYRMDKDVRWNQDACRNIGYHHAQTQWMLMTDMDHVVPEETWSRLVFRKHDPTKVFKFSRVSAPGLEPYKPHPNTWFLTRALFDRAGGYDERFAGYYGTDADVRDRFTATATEVVLLKECVIRVPREVIPDASTTTYQRKQPEDKIIPKLLAERRLRKEPTKRMTFSYHRVF